MAPGEELRFDFLLFGQAVNLQATMYHLWGRWIANGLAFLEV